MLNKTKTIKLFVFSTVIFTLLINLYLLVVFDRHELKIKKQIMSEKYNQIPESPNSKDLIGLSSIILPASEEKEIKEIIKKEYNSQWKHCFAGNNSEMSELYLPDEYQLFKQKVEAETEFEFDRRCREEMDITQKEMDYFTKNTVFSKFRKYRDLDDRVGVIVSFGGIYYSPFIKKNQNKIPFSFNVGIITAYSRSNYFLLKKTNNYWKIERKLSQERKHFFNETSIIKQLLEQKNNETPKAEITES
ncbi:MAG: hypothetical protein U9N04_00495 [Patescibacteria group bacterium]|nr:hypothetical protein [Patescibacteria group bacterium]